VISPGLSRRTGGEMVAGLQVSTVLTLIPGSVILMIGIQDTRCSGILVFQVTGVEQGICSLASALWLSDEERWVYCDLFLSV